MMHPTLGLLLTFSLLVAPLAAEAQPAAKSPRIGVLFGTTPASEAPRVEAFRQGLRELGYVEGQTIALEYRWAEGRFEHVARLAADLVRLPVDVLVTGGPLTTRAAQDATQTIPIVMAMVNDPVGAGFVASLARPGGNLTGLSTMGSELAGKRLELLTELRPTLSRVALLWSPINPGTVAALQEAEVAAHALGVSLLLYEIHSPNDFEGAFHAASQGRAGAVMTLGPIANTHRRRLVALAAEHRLPAIYNRREFVEDGGLMAYGPSLTEMGRRAATYVDKILKGAKPAELPVEQPMQFELAINLKTAQALGLAIPSSLLLQATEVIR
jgi:putative ABC transport system substrate-binding protein